MLAHLSDAYSDQAAYTEKLLGTTPPEAQPFCFAIIVNWITNWTLDRINMVEALKSVE